ncbi:MAG: lysophospholipid acyltransferase family protein [Saprospiraceae bacterium]|nr:lysophospholipid acyltransferase family protein [Saprospiraceae bacterium]
MAYIGFLVLRLVVALFRLIPFWLLYRLSDGLAFLLHRVVGYRKTVVRNHLRRAFPEKSAAEIEQITRDAYRNLSDITLETIKGFSAPMSELNRRCRWVNPEVLNKYLNAGQSVLVNGGHINSWEWPCFTVGHWITGPVYVTYKPLTNAYVDRYYNAGRSRSGAHMISMEDTAVVIRAHHGKEAGAYFLISDQSPSSVKNAHWLDFFGIDTAFLPGPDFLARRYKYPVVFLYTRRVKRGFYEVVLEDFFPDPAQASDKTITAAYVELLEEIIRKEPGSWLWSHKRWKHTRQAAG